MARKAKRVEGMRLEPSCDNAWSCGSFTIFRMDWEKPESRWYAIWTDLFSVKHTVKRATFGELKKAVEAGETR